MAIADELIAILGFDLRGEGAAQRYEQAIANINKRLDAMVVATGRVAGYAALAMAGAVGLMGRSVIGATAQFETFEATLTTIEGTSEKARQSLDWIADFAKTTPYDVAGVTDAFIQLKAYGIDPIADDALRTLGDTAAAMGKPLDQAVQMFADASSMEFERLKEFGIRAAQVGDEVTFTWTENGQELTRTMKKDGDEVRAFILENLGTRFAGAMDRQSRTYAGMMSNLGDSWQDFQRRIGGAGFFDNIKDKLGALLDLIGRLDADGTLDAWAQAFSDNLSFAADTLWFIGERIFNNALFISENWDALSGYVTTFGAGLALLIARAFPVITAFILIGLAIDDLLAYMQGGESVIGDFVGWIRDTLNISDDAAEVLAGLAAAVGSALSLAFLVAPLRILGLFDTLMMASVRATASGVTWALTSGFAGSRRAMTAAWGAIKTAGTAAIGLLGPAFRLALVGMSAAVDAGIAAALFLLTNPVGWAILLAGAAAGLIYYFWDDIVLAWEGLSAQATALFTQLKDWVLAIDWYGLGMAMIQAIFDGLKSIGSAISDWFSGLFQLPTPDYGKLVPTAGELGYTGPRAGGSGGMPPLPSGITPEAGAALGAYLDNVGRMSGGSAATAVVTDNSQDNRAAPLTVNTTVNQTVTQPSDAPQAAANATGAAVSRRAAEQRSQIEQEPSF